MPSPSQALRADSPSKLKLLLLHAHAPSPPVPPQLVCPPSDKEPTMDSTRPVQSQLEAQSAPSQTLKSSNKEPPNAAHATLDPTPLPPQVPRPDTTTSLVPSQLLSQLNGQRMETPPPKPPDRPTSNPLQLSRTLPTPATVHPTVAALPSVPTTEPSESEQVETAAPATEL